jgi:hypothetical protein
MRLVFASAPLYTVFKALWAQIMDSTATAFFSLLASRRLRLRGRSVLLDSDLTAFDAVEIQEAQQILRSADLVRADERRVTSGLNSVSVTHIDKSQLWIQTGLEVRSK